MARFISKEKLSKKARKAQNDLQRQTWDVCPVTRKVESKKVYRRKKSPDRYDEYGGDTVVRSIVTLFASKSSR